MDKIWEFPASVKLIDKKGKVVLRVLTQLYKTSGMYVAEYWYENDTPSQFGLLPSNMIKYMAQFKQDNLTEGVTSEFGNTIKVTTDANGLFIRVD
jgi:hypothetical protein